MRGKLWFALGAAAGFVLGARAGRDKYDQLVLNARKVWDHPTVQEAAGVVQAQANRLYHEGKETMTEKLASTRLGERLSTPSATAEQDTLATSSTASSTGATSADMKDQGTPTGSAY